jgi:Flp pilus assembly protein TadD
VANLQRLRHKFLLREAEGYLELLSLDDQKLRLDLETRRPLLERALAILKPLDRVGRIGKSDAAAPYLQGEICRQLERFDEAISHLRRALERDPDDVRIYLALGWCCKRTDRLDLAIEALESAMTVAHEEPTVHYNLACYWSLARNVKLAVRFLASAIALDERFRELVSSESDFDPVRDAPEFAAALSGSAISRAAD